MLSLLPFLSNGLLLWQGADGAPQNAEGEKPMMDTVMELAKLHGPNIIGALLIFIIGRIVVKIITKGVRKVLEKKGVDATLIGFIGSLVNMLLLAFVVMAALERLGVDTTSFAAIIAAAGLAIGLALQGTLGNFASGVMIIFFRPFKSGDFIEAGGVSGSVEEIQIFNTVMKTGDNKKIIVPNGAITGGNIINYSAKETRRIDMVVGIGYGDDIKKAKQILERILNADERVLKDPEPKVAVGELADSSVNFVVRPWVKSADYWATLWDLNETIKMTFDAEGISIPFPQRDVHLFQEAAA